jgi:hypothetical protein
MAWELNGNQGTNSQTNFLGTTDDQPLVVRTGGVEALRVNTSGAGASRVEIPAQDGLSVSGFQPFITLRDTNGGNARSIVQGVEGHVVVIPESFAGSGGAAMVVRTGSGNVGIGTSEPSSKLEIIAQDGVAVTGFQPFITLRDTNGGNARSVVQGVEGHVVVIPDSFIGSGGAAMIVKSGSGNVGIGTPNPSSKLEVDGTGEGDPPATLRVRHSGAGFAGFFHGMVGVDGNLNVNFDIGVLGDIKLVGGDIAEEFDLVGDEAAEPGSVVVLTGGDNVQVSDQPYDRRVAGVVSGAGNYRPGMILDRRSGSARLPLALSGKVWCKVDADCGPIDVGDLLTTSSTPGHAMRATDPARSFGAVIGKALAGLTSGRALVPVLVALQ